MTRPQRAFALVFALALGCGALAVPPQVTFEVDEMNGQTDLIIGNGGGGGGTRREPEPESAVGGQITFTDHPPSPAGIVVAKAIPHTEKLTGGAGARTSDEDDAANRNRKRTEALDPVKVWLKDLLTKAGADNLNKAARDAVQPTLVRIRMAQQKAEREIARRNAEFLSNLEREVTGHVYNAIKTDFSHDMGSEEADTVMVRAKVLAYNTMDQVTRQFFGLATPSESSHHESSHESSHHESSHHESSSRSESSRSKSESSKAESSEASALVSSLSSILSEESAAKLESSHESSHPESSHHESAAESSHESSHPESSHHESAAAESSRAAHESTRAEESAAQESSEHGSEHAESGHSEEASEGSFPHESARFRQNETPRMSRLQSLLHQIQNSRARGFRFREIPRA